MLTYAAMTWSMVGNVGMVVPMVLGARVRNSCPISR